MNREICGQCGQSLDPGWVDERVPKLESMLREAIRERDSLRQHLHDEHQRHVGTMAERDAALADLAAAQAVVRDICAEWNEDCDPDCDSIAHSPTCKATNIANAKRALQADLAAAQTALRDLIGILEIAAVMPDAIHKHMRVKWDDPGLQRARAALAEGEGKK